MNNQETINDLIITPDEKFIIRINDIILVKPIEEFDEYLIVISGKPQQSIIVDKENYEFILTKIKEYNNASTNKEHVPKIQESAANKRSKKYN